MPPPCRQHCSAEAARALGRRHACVVSRGWLQVLCEDSTTLRSLLTMRQPYTAPVNFMQVEVIRRVRSAAQAATAAAQGDAQKEVVALVDGAPLADWQDCLLLTVNGIAAGMRNTG
jgi:phosphoenolpyruvate carboxylase